MINEPKSNTYVNYLRNRGKSDAEIQATLARMQKGNRE